VRRLATGREAYRTLHLQHGAARVYRPIFLSGGVFRLAALRFISSAIRLRISGVNLPMDLTGVLARFAGATGVFTGRVLLAGGRGGASG
jgi:hypothetical protein